jgi:hypothetical protein
VLYETDEISALWNGRGPEEGRAMVDDMIRRLEAELRSIKDPQWRIWPVERLDGGNGDEAAR